MSGNVFDQRIVRAAKNGGPITIDVTLTDETVNDPAMTFTSTCTWNYIASGDDPEGDPPPDSDSLNDCKALIKLGTRPSTYNASRVDVAVTCGDLTNAEHTYSVKMKVEQLGRELDSFPVDHRKFKSTDVFTVSFLFRV